MTVCDVMNADVHEKGINVREQAIEEVRAEPRFPGFAESEALYY